MILKDLLNLYNFRLYRDDIQSNYLKEDTSTVRIYIDIDMWFEFGICDWSNNEVKRESIEKILTKDILNKEVDYFNVNDENNLFSVHLKY